LLLKGFPCHWSSHQTVHSPKHLLLKSFIPYETFQGSESWQTRCYSSLRTEKHPKCHNPVISNRAKAGTWSITRNNKIMNWTLWIMSQAAR
jgi:hypothetical protein